MKQMEEIVLQIYDLLYRLGVTAQYVGFFHIAYATLLCAEQPERLQFATKWVYPDVAKQYHTDCRDVERSIAAAGSVIWEQNRPLLEKLAHRPLEHRPSNAQLLAILVSGLPPSGPLAGCVWDESGWAVVQ